MVVLERIVRLESYTSTDIEGWIRIIRTHLTSNMTISGATFTCSSDILLMALNIEPSRLWYAWGGG